MNIERIIEVKGASKASDSFKGSQFTHFGPVGSFVENVPYFGGFMLVLPLGSVAVGKRFKMILEEIKD